MIVQFKSTAIVDVSASEATAAPSPACVSTAGKIPWASSRNSANARPTSVSGVVEQFDEVTVSIVMAACDS